MAKKKPRNKKRLTKKQVRELIETKGKLHLEYTKFFEQTDATGYKNQPLVYELPDNLFLFVFDYKQRGIGGKGDLYPKEYFLRLVKWTQKVKDDAEHNRNTPVANWMYYSKQKTYLVNQIDKFINELIVSLGIEESQLDFSYDSLDVLSKKIEYYGVEKAQVELYDCLVAYVGEVLRRKVNGQWAVQSLDANSDYPCISTDVNKYLMPINVVWQELSGLLPVNLRKETVKERHRYTLYKANLSGAFQFSGNARSNG